MNLKEKAKRLYLQGKSTTEVGKLIGKSSSVVGRYLREQGVEMRKRWDRGHGIRADGKKQCVICEDWKPADDKHFYWIKKDKRLSSYCKPCDSARACKSQADARKAKKDADANRKRERMRHNAQSRLILAEAMRVIADKTPDLDIVYEIQAHLSLGKKLFHDS